MLFLGALGVFGNWAVFRCLGGIIARFHRHFDADRVESLVFKKLT